MEQVTKYVIKYNKNENTSCCTYKRKSYSKIVAEKISKSMDENYEGFLKQKLVNGLLFHYMLLL